MTGNETVFARREALDGADSAVSFVLDQSGSMGYTIATATACIAVLCNVLAQCHGVRTEILGFKSYDAPDSLEKEASEAARDAYDDSDMDESDGGSFDYSDEGYKEAATVNRCALTVYKTYRESAAIGLARMYSRACATGGTPDLAALVSAGRRLMKQTAGRRILIMVTDGEGDSAARMRKAIRNVQAHGVLVIGLGIGYSGCNDAYDYRCTVQDVSDLGGETLRALLRVIEKDTDAGRVP